MTSEPALRDVVLVGAGHAHVEVLRAFGLRPIPGVRLTLITREAATPYSGMLPGWIAGHYDYDDVQIDCRKLARFSGARLYLDEMTGLDPVCRAVICRNRPPVAFDVLSLDIGSTPNTSSVPGAAAYAIPVKPIEGLLCRFAALRARIPATDGACRIAVVGGGAGGVELMLATERRLRRDVAAAGGNPGRLSFVLIPGVSGVLPRFPQALRQRIITLCGIRGITIAGSGHVEAVESGLIRLSDQSTIPAHEILWATEAAAPAWLGGTGLALDGKGFVQVDGSLRAIGHDDVFAAGDIAAFTPHNLPKAGVYAVREGRVLAVNIRRTLSGRAPRPYRPQREVLHLISTGEKSAIGTRNGLAFAGSWVWRWKDWVDRRFMARFNNLPD